MSVAVAGTCDSALFQVVLTLVGGDQAAATDVCTSYDVRALTAPAAVSGWTVSQLRASAAEVSQLHERVAQVGYSLDVAFVLFSSYQVFMMQLGFALFAAGVVRPKNIVAIFLKNFFDTAIAGVMFYLTGYAFAFGAKDGDTNGFIGNWNFALSATDGSPGDAGQPHPWHLFMWNWSFCSAATTILSGSIAERATFASYTIYAILMPAWVYPVVAHWLWAPQGWLSAKNMSGRILGVGAIDYAGSGVVHLVGGVSALVGSIFTGPRVGRFGGNGVSPQIYHATAAPQLYLMGTFLLWFGWYGFNPGSRLEIDSYVASTIVGRTAVTTTLAACSASLVALLLAYWRHRVWDMLATCMGALAGLVSITAGCAVLEPWAAIICGVVAAFVCDAGEQLMERLQIDDPVSAFPVHGLCGAWGLLYVGLMAQENYVYENYNVQPGHHRMGLFYGGHAQLLLCQVIAIVVISGWTAVNMAALFGGMKAAGVLRVGVDKEAAGMDVAACGQMEAPGAVNIHSSKVVTKGELGLAAVSMDRRINGGPGLDYSLRNPNGVLSAAAVVGNGSANPSNHASVRPEPLPPTALASAAVPMPPPPAPSPAALGAGSVVPPVVVNGAGGSAGGSAGGVGGAADGMVAREGSATKVM